MITFGATELCLDNDSFNARAEAMSPCVDTTYDIRIRKDNAAEEVCAMTDDNDDSYSDAESTVLGASSSLRLPTEASALCAVSCSSW